VFELTRDGQAIRFTGKAQQRPLDLMKALVVLGGIDVDVQQLTSMLWPDADGAAAKTSFDSTLFRLRKLLDIEHVLALTAGKLSLNKAIAWTDLWSLDATLEQAERVRDAETAQHAARAVLSAYTGPLLASEESPWAAKPRDAIRSRFVRTLTRLGEALEHEHAWVAAAELYRRGLELDNLAEAFYRGLMRALIAMGEQAEALNVFRRCRELLSIVLGMSPAPATERLHQQILSAHRPAR
jgi:DNA-binding SARP family transcriptional activator